MTANQTPKQNSTEGEMACPLPIGWQNDQILDQDLRRGLELHFFAHLNLAEDADQQMADMSFGRTHHRILYFVKQKPGITVGEMLSVLRVSHQNIQRALSGMIRQGFIEQKTSMQDRRQRRLYATESGTILFNQLTERQFQRISKAYRSAGQEAVEGFWKVLWHMIEPSDQEWVIRKPGEDTPP
ncbi:MAG: MarR family transcriptional regulator [Alphaproteobacteria bacterium]|nr:MarR family transcriptional regulator [Alphaproteobacteria bacterium]